VFRNDSPSYILVQSYTEGFEAVVNIYGTPDGRTVALHGPFVGPGTTDALGDHKLHSNEIGWAREVTRSDGTVQNDVLLSRYKELPRTVVKQYSVAMQ